MVSVILLFGVLSAYHTLQPGKSVRDAGEVQAQEQEIKAKLDSLAVDYTVREALPAEAEKISVSTQPSEPTPKPSPAPATPPAKAKVEPPRDAIKKSAQVKEVTKQPAVAVAAPAAPPVQAKKPGAIETKAPVAPELAEKPAIQKEPIEVALKPVTARPVVAPKPRVLMATKEKAWVRIDDLRTVIVKKGDSLPELGKVLELDDKAVKFEKGTFPVTSE